MIQNQHQSGQHSPYMVTQQNPGKNCLIGGLNILKKEERILTFTQNLLKLNQKSL
jgi:hypothetical protein